MERVARLQGLLLHVSQFPHKNSHNKRNLSLLSQALGKERPSMFPQNGAPMETDANSRSLLSISFGIPSKGAVLHSSFKGPGIRAPFQVPQWGPYGEMPLSGMLLIIYIQVITTRAVCSHLLSKPIYSWTPFPLIWCYAVWYSHNLQDECVPAQHSWTSEDQRIVTSQKAVSTTESLGKRPTWCTITLYNMFIIIILCMFWCFADRASQYNLSNWPTLCTKSHFIISLLYTSTCFEQCAHHQEVKIVLYSIWYRHTCRWPSRAQSSLYLCTGCPPTGVMIPDAV